MFTLYKKSEKGEKKKEKAFLYFPISSRLRRGGKNHERQKKEKGRGPSTYSRRRGRKEGKENKVREKKKKKKETLERAIFAFTSTHSISSIIKEGKRKD